jgi:hypothetical protein
MSDEHLSDEELEQRIRGSLHDPVPDDLLRISEGLFAWRTIDAELAELEISEAEVAASVRGADSTVLTFAIDDRLIEVEVDEVERAMVVDLGGRWAAGIDLVTPSGTAVAGLMDDAGVCRFSDLPSGPVQIVITRDDGVLVKTRWITL